MKNHVEVAGDRVIKQFRTGHNRFRRYWRECVALQRLRDLYGVPRLLACRADVPELELERIAGRPFADANPVPDAFYRQLRALVDETLRRGVARHSLPPRDILVQPDGTPALVDFERVTLRRWPHGVLWWAASAVTRFHVLRFVGAHAPHLLSPTEHRRLAAQYRIRGAFHRYVDWRKRHFPDT